MIRIPRRDLLRSGLALSASSLATRSAWGRAAALLSSSNAPPVLIEAESFTDTGGWVIDQEFSDRMGSAFLLAHGMGTPVADAHTEIEIPAAGTYRVWVRTRDWVAPWKAPGAPGRFNLIVNGKTIETTFGTEGEAWHWQDGGSIDLPEGKVALALHDLAGFDGRCDAILFAADTNFRPPGEGPVLAAFRKQALGHGPVPEDAGLFDLVIVGGGMAGSACAISAARLGMKVALIQDRPVLGGNSSSEIRVSPVGDVNLPPYPALGVVVAELDSAHRGFAKPAATYDDAKKLRVVKAENNIRLFMNTHVFALEKQGNRITAVIARDIMSSRELRFSAPLFADCTGDGDIGFLAGADYRYGRESQVETGEPSAQVTADRHTSGTTIMWYSEDSGGAASFPETPWALQFNEDSVQNATNGGVHWEAGCTRDQLAEAELIRDSLFRAIYGNWAYQKNSSVDKAKYENLRLVGWVGYVAGKRESRRLLGDVVLREQDILNGQTFPDACVTTTWCMDLHVPDPKNMAQFQDDSFRTVAVYIKKPPYAIPYRCFYSRNIDNLFLAGRDISVTHVALGTVRLQRTTGMMGEVVGMAAAIARKHKTSPRGVYQDHLSELKEVMTRGVGKSALAPPPRPSVPEGYELTWSDEFDADFLDRSKWNFRTDTKHWSTQLPRNIAFSDSNLLITLNKIAHDGTDLNTTAAVLSKSFYGYVPEGGEGQYTGGGVISKDAFGYGYFETRMRIMAGKGWHSSFWLMSHDGSGGTGTAAADLELDIVENDSIDPLSYGVTTHKWKGGHESYGQKRVATLPLFDYHVYGCEYTPAVVKYFFDGELVQTVDISSLPQGKFNIWLTSIGSSLGDTDSVDDSRLPGHVDFDYVRFYRKADESK
jgi:beta-glucanase (GH16 family)